MEKIQNTDHIASNLCNETVIPVYVIDNADEFVRKCKPYHIIDVKSDAYEANNVKSSSIDNSDKIKNTSSLMEVWRSHENIVNQEQLQKKVKSDTSNCAKLHVKRVSSTVLTNKVANTQTPVTKVNEFTECTLSEEVQQNKPYQMCFSSCFSKDDKCTHNHENDHFCCTNKFDKVATYISDDNDMSWCQEQQINMKEFQWAITTFDKVYAHFILTYVNDANREFTTSDNDRVATCNNSQSNDMNSRQAHNKCYCSVCGRSVQLNNTVEKESRSHENNNNVHVHNYGLRCASCGCVAHLFCWGLTCTNIEYSNWKCKACECKITIGTSQRIHKEHYQLRQQERKQVQNSNSRKVQRLIKCAFCGKGCEEGAMFQYAPYQDKTNEIYAKSNLGTKNVQSKYKIVSVPNLESNNIQHSLSEKEKLELLELTTSKFEHCLDTMLWCHAVCALTSQITHPVFILHNDCEEHTATNRTTQTRCESTSKRNSNMKPSHASKHRTVSVISSSGTKYKRGNKDATRTSHHTLHKTELIFIAHKRLMRPRDVQSLECNYCHISDGWRVRCAHSRCFQVVHPLCAAHYHAVECLSSLEWNSKHTSCDTGKCNRECENAEMLFRSGHSDGNSKGEFDVKRILSNLGKSRSTNQASYWTKCNVYCSQHAKFYVSPQSNYSYYSEHENNQSSSATFASAGSISNAKSNGKYNMPKNQNIVKLLDKSSNKIITMNSDNTTHTRLHLLSHEELNTLAENAVVEYAMTMSIKTNTCNHISQYKVSDISSLPMKLENIKRKRGRPASVGRDAHEEIRGHDQIVMNDKLMQYWMCKRAQRRMESEQIMHAINITRTRPIGTAALRAELVKVTPERVKISSFMCLTPEWQQRLITEVEEYLPLPDDEYEELWSKMRPRRRALTRRECSRQECLHRLSTFTECMENMCNLSSVLHLACVQRHRCVEATLHELQWRLRHYIDGDEQ